MENLFKKRQERLELFKSRRIRTNKDLNKKEVPENLIKNCEVCHKNVPYEDMMNNLYVCPNCSHHLKISARERIRQLTDKSTFRELDRNLESSNEDEFPGYTNKLDKSKKSTGLHEAVVTGVGRINTEKIALAVMDSNFMMGSMGQIVGEKITRITEYAMRRKLPLLISCTSGGARMQEGIMSLMQMAKTSAALKKFSDEGGFYISLLTHPTTGGVSASFAMLGDIIISEPNALVGFAGKRVIENTINETLPKEFQRAEFLLEKGFIDMVVDRTEMKKTIYELIMLHKGVSL
ncbi:acetyl-CoA carboxylase, carboxyltransferase subunit beta [Anaerofustis stercorihominis]|uniref:acetyl-CoA carboxylase, carboxyltransferase subunit beta n=1 Tax=Anaerofustis stercorihominis TaxID=214853 RepID=UPI00214B09F7|nr:acetyl-CoA carboxylase, carboxyltransferase subunit beta [Anaerofustis stercorihominis]